MRTFFLLLHIQTVSSYLLRFNTVPCLNLPLPEGRAGTAEEPAEPSVLLVNKCNVSPCTSYCFFCFSASSTYLAELVRKTNRKTVEPYSLCDHKTQAVTFIYSLLSLFVYFFRMFYPDRKIELWLHPSPFEFIMRHSHYVTPPMSEQRTVLYQRSCVKISSLNNTWLGTLSDHAVGNLIEALR